MNQKQSDTNSETRSTPSGNESPARDAEGREVPGAHGEELPPVTCQNCGREVSKLDPVCPYCGLPLVGA